MDRTGLGSRAHRLGRAALWAVVAAAAGCSSSAKPGIGSPALVAMASCDEALGFVRQVALARMNQQIDEQLARFERGEGCYAWAAEDGVQAGPGATGAPAPAPSAPGKGGGNTTTPLPPSSPDHATNASGTNNQVAGVDEADFVKNDGKYIYLAQNGVLRIVDAYPGAAAHQISKTPLDGTPRKLFVEGDRALVYLSVPDPRTSSSSGGGVNGTGKALPPTYGGGRECTYGYDCDFTGDGTSTKLVIFDLHDRAQPKKLRELFLSGSLLAARRVGNATHTVVTDNLQLFPELSYYPNVNLCDDSATPGYGTPWPPSGARTPSFAALSRARQVYAELREKNRQIILGKDLSQVLPRLGDDAFGASALDASPLCDGLYRAQLLDGASFTTLVSVDLAATEPARAASIVSSPGAVYASDEALYLAVPSERSYGGPWYDQYGEAEQLSSIHKFRISASPADTGYVGSGLVKGRVLNQFAMDEQKGYLRVATTSGHVPDPKVESQLTVLADEGNALGTVGLVEHLAPGEDIRSVRFDGERGFVVTFKKTDPLFVLDLADPQSPKVVGELKIPGFSTYLHMLDEQHLLSIGYDADDHGSFAFFNGVLLQIFDVSDAKNPTLAQRYTIGTRGSSSEALTNHLAFNYFAPLKMLAVPMTVCEGGGDGRFGDQLTFSGLMLFDIDAVSGIREHGRVAHPIPDPSNPPWGGAPNGCSNWWTNASSEVKRSIFMDRWVYSISDQILEVQSIDALGTNLAGIALEP